MATMWPREIPPWVRADSRREAEIKVFEKLNEALDSSWSVYYSRPWWGLNERGGEVDGEADFIVAHPDQGILFLEVKGGGIDHDPSTSQWTTINRFHVRKNIKNPVEQAVKSKHQFLKKLRQFPDWPETFIRLRHGVVFPDADETGTRAGFFAGIEKEIFCLARQFAMNFGDWVKERLCTHQSKGVSGEANPGPLAISILERVVAEPVRLKVPIGRTIGPILEQQEILMTGHQLAAATMLHEVQRGLIVGGAGTGKTLLACEMAARLASGNQPVAVVCLAAPLAAWLRVKLENWPSITVFEFPQFCSEVIRLTGRHFEGRPEALPEIASRLLGSDVKIPWYAVVVDEGQDFLPAWWDVIEGLARNGLPKLRVFYDSNQAVYARKDDLETRLAMQAFPLCHNLRNSKEIGSLAERLYEGPRLETCGPSGSPVTLTSCEVGEAVEVIAHRLMTLTRGEMVPPGDLAVLVPSEEWIGPMGKAASAVPVSWTRARPGHGNLLTIETIARFKGLEAPIVLMLSDRSAGNSRELSYVAVTRARVRLEVFGPLTGTLLAQAQFASVAKSELTAE